MTFDYFINYILIPLVKIGILFGVLSGVIAYLTLLERKVIAFMQVRLGPMRVGPYGLLQPIADGLEADAERRHRAVAGRPCRLHAGAGHHVGSGIHCFFGHSVRRTVGDSHSGVHRAGHKFAFFRNNDGFLHHGPEYRRALRAVDLVDRNSRNHPWRLGIEQQIPVARRPALGSSDGEL